MAKVCFLCGGPLREGRCTECGLDNSKNDKKYQLNMHNDSGAHFHDGDCEDQLNKARRPLRSAKKKKAEQQDVFNYSEMLEKEKKKPHSGSSYRKGNGSGSAASTARNSSAGKKKAGRLAWLLVIYAVICVLSAIFDAVSENWDGIWEIFESLGRF